MSLGKCVVLFRKQQEEKTDKLCRASFYTDELAISNKLNGTNDDQICVVDRRIIGEGMFRCYPAFPMVKNQSGMEADGTADECGNTA